MVKLNFMSTPPISTTYDGAVEELPEIKEAPPVETPVEPAVSEDFADSLFEFDEKQPIQPEKPEVESAPAAAAPGEAEAPKEPAINETERENYRFHDSDGTWKKYTLFAAAALLLVAIGFFAVRIFLNTGDSGENVVAKDQTQAASVEKTTPAENAVPATNEQDRQHQENIRQNAAIYKNIQNLLKQPSRSVTMDLLVLSPPFIQVTVLADSRDEIAKYHMTMKNDYPNYGFQIVSVHSEEEDGAAKFSADLVGLFPKSSGGSASGANGQNIVLSALQREIKKMAGASKINIASYKQGAVSSKGTCNAYMALRGDTGNLLNFFKNFAAFLPQTKLNKVALNRRKSGSGMSARVNFSFWQ